MAEETKATETKVETTATGTGAETKTETKVETTGNETATGVNKTETVLGGEKTGTEKVTAPADWPADWREKMAGGDAKKLEFLKRYASPNAVTDGALAMRSKVATGELKPTLPENATPEQVAEFRKANDVPDKPDGYMEKLPEGMVIGETDKALWAEFAKGMHEANMPKGVMTQVLAGYHQIAEKIASDRAEADKAFRTESDDALHAEWGGEYRGNLGTIMNYMNSTFGEDTANNLLGARLADGKPLANSPAILKALLQAATDAGHTNVVVHGATGDVGKDIQSRKAEIQKLMGDQSSEYWVGPKSPALKAEYLQLVAAEEKIAGRKAA